MLEEGNIRNRLDMGSRGLDSGTPVLRPEDFLFFSGLSEEVEDFTVIGFQRERARESGLTGAALACPARQTRKMIHTLIFSVYGHKNQNEIVFFKSFGFQHKCLKTKSENEQGLSGVP